MRKKEQALQFHLQRFGEFASLPLPIQVRVVICNSMVKHAVATEEYGDRRDESLFCLGFKSSRVRTRMGNV
jgi:galactokinase